MCLNETCSKVHTGKHLSDKFLMPSYKKLGVAFLPLLFNFPSEYALRKVIQVELKLNGTNQLLVYAAAVNLQVDNVNTTKRNKETLTLVKGLV
jgi:hypothetical protein